ncbi:polysaccharide deacetylase family protein [Sunxiuqinia sp. A32]|uniref:polysaccharide deacetylase family protein n=1 Tax=Sunxiuqinia sp. A32 TaxID=3461496 RepID=UPI00404669FB
MDPRIRLPRFLTACFPEALWRIPGENNLVYLTFDDGPVPEITPWVLDLLKEEKIKACFFCVGENVKRYPEIYQRIIDEGHLVGNHTFNHLQGLKTPNMKFFRNILKASTYIESNFFRPPHGWMKQSQYEQIKQHYQVVMWDIISGDYKSDITPGLVARNVLTNVRPGSIITFHDSLKAKENLYRALPVVIQKLKLKGYHFGSLPANKQEIRIAI